MRFRSAVSSGQTRTLLYLNIRCLWESTLPTLVGNQWLTAKRTSTVENHRPYNSQRSVQQSKNTMLQTRSKELSLLFTTQRLQQRKHRAKNSVPSPTNLPPGQNVPFYRPSVLSLTYLIFSVIFFFNKIAKIRNEFDPQSPCLPQINVSLEAH